MRSYGVFIVITDYIFRHELEEKLRKESKEVEGLITAKSKLMSELAANEKERQSTFEVTQKVTSEKEALSKEYQDR